MKKLFLSLLIFSAICLQGATVTVSPQNAEIVRHKNANVIVQFAAEELQKHLQLISGVKLPIKFQATPGKYAICLFPPPGEKNTLALENAKIKIGAKQTHIWGEDYIGTRKWENKRQNIFYKKYRTGTLFGVYEFLEKQFGVKWSEPGDRGIIYTPSKNFKLNSGEYSWAPKLIQRELRRGSYSYSDYKYRTRNSANLFQLDKVQYQNHILDIQTWLKRQKMGNSYFFWYGHAFTSWWKKYGKTHPEFFAMQKNGQRGPEDPRHPEYVKLCVSNPELIDLIVKKWGHHKFINICENDAGGYCQCPKCLALDAPLSGEKFDDHLSDRYVWFANQIQQKVAKINPEAQVVCYAYDRYRHAPRKTKIDPRIIVGFVPELMNINAVEKIYREWHKMGLRNVFLRPNHHHIACGLPMGYEKALFDQFKLGVKYGIMGTDYDALHNFWPTGGFADYILARAHSNPEKSFEYWENDYCAIYGAASSEVKAYYRYWRDNVWQQRLIPDNQKISKLGRYGNFRRGLMWSLGKYYRAADFDRTDAILAQGAQKNLSPAERARLENLQLTNLHARLTYNAVVAKGDQKFLQGKKLLDFRKKNYKKLSFDWGRLVKFESDFGDITGIQLAELFKDYNDTRPLGVIWKFQPDPEKKGEKEHWEKLRYSHIRQHWENIRVDRAWEKQLKRQLSPALWKLLKNYDGIGYYATLVKIPPQWRGKKIYLFFNAVDESAKVYVEGKFAGARPAKNEDDWKTPFTIRIDPFIDWNSGAQLVVVQVEDVAGAGGIWRPVYLVEK